MGRTYAILHTPPGPGGIAVVLLAGPATRGILKQVFVPRSAGQGEALDNGRLMLGELRDEHGRIDEAIVTLLPAGPNRGDLAEINVHGGPRVAQRVLGRLAEAGAVVCADGEAATAAQDVWPLSAEGMDNPAIGRELLAALPQARTPLAAEMLTAQWSAGLSALAWRALQDGPRPQDAQSLRAAAERLSVMNCLLHPPEVVLAGPPNAGKSSLANALLARRACIVTDTPGATRDWVRELADLAGLTVWLTDTAGLWSPPDALDAEAVQRAWRQIDRADLVLAVYDVTDPPARDDAVWRRLLGEPNVIRVANKIDLAEPIAGCVNVSAHTGEELPRLCRVVQEALGLIDLSPQTSSAFTARQADLLSRAADAIDAGQSDQARQALRQLLGQAAE